ncbi:hypothetical protein Q3G72_019317 [Acer saccharum]|nr:hypothetical protein Q3G72_019317 [Acer saccharum]
MCQGSAHLVVDSPHCDLSGRGGGMGAAFGGASGQIFGGRGASNFLSRVTSAAAIVFFCTSLTLSMMSSRHRSVVLKSGMLPAHSGKADAAPPAKDAEEAAQNEIQGATDGSLKGDVPSHDAEAPAPKRPDAPAATPPGVPTGEE